jgi:hypothetical protein
MQSTRTGTQDTQILAQARRNSQSSGFKYEHSNSHSPHNFSVLNLQCLMGKVFRQTHLIGPAPGDY